MIDRLFAWAVGGALLAAGLMVLVSNGVSLPARNGGPDFRFTGTSQLLMALGPALLGAGLTQVRPRRRPTPLVECLLVAGLVCVVAALLIAPRY